jgi:hypothetical protein
MCYSEISNDCVSTEFMMLWWAAPGKSRILVVNARNFMTHLSSGPAWWQLFPRWMDHQMMLNLFDGDLTLLHDQVSNFSF